MANITQGRIHTRTDIETVTAGYEILSTSSQSKVLKIDGEDDFDLVLVKLTENESQLAKKYPGCTVFVVVPKIIQKSKVFNFLGLSAELRNMVYHELLVFQDPILLKGRNKIQFGISTTRRDPFNKPARPDLRILRTNKQINNEATQVFYGNNTFGCSSNSTMVQFGEVLGARFLFVRHLVIDQSLFITTARRLAELLATLPHLETFRIQYHPVLDGSKAGDIIPAERLVEEMFHLFYRLYIQHRSFSKTFKIVSFVGQEQLLREHPGIAHGTASGDDKYVQCCEDRERYARKVRHLTYEKVCARHPKLRTRILRNNKRIALGP